MRILGLSGSLRKASHNTGLLRTAARRLPPGVTLDVWDGLATIPPYDEDREAEETPAAVADLKRAIAEADAVLVATPEYNASIPGVLKNALDWVSRPTVAESPLRGKPAAVIGASTGMFGAVWAQAEVRKVLRTIGAVVLEDEIPVAHAHDAFTEDGDLRDPEIVAQLDKVLGDLERAAEPAVAA
jgi:chromate reductase